MVIMKKESTSTRSTIIMIGVAALVFGAGASFGTFRIEDLFSPTVLLFLGLLTFLYFRTPK